MKKTINSCGNFIWTAYALVHVTVGSPNLVVFSGYTSDPNTQISSKSLRIHIRQFSRKKPVIIGRPDEKDHRPIDDLRERYFWNLILESSRPHYDNPGGTDTSESILAPLYTSIVCGNVGGLYQSVFLAPGRFNRLLIYRRIHTYIPVCICLVLRKVENTRYLKKEAQTKREI